MTNTEAERIEKEYLERLRHMLRRVPDDIREDAVSEVRSHIEDEWEALGRNTSGLYTVLERLGPPEDYGRDLALQLMLMRGRERRSPTMLAWAGLFWATTSLVGSVGVLISALFFAFGLGMVLVAWDRLQGKHTMLIDSVGYRIFGYYIDRVRFPPEAWSPLVTALVGLVPTLVFFVVLYRIFTLWIGSRLAERGVQSVINRGTVILSRGWEQRAVLTMTLLAMLSLGSCVLLDKAVRQEPIGDLVRTSLLALQCLSVLVFLGSPMLGLLWAAGRMR